MFRHAVRTFVALAVAMAPALADATLYRWVDELGVTHYATDLDAIPSDARDDALEIVASPPPVASTRAVPVPPVAPEVVAPEPPSAPAPELAPPAAAPAAAPEPAPLQDAPPEVAPAERAAARPTPAVTPSSESRPDSVPVAPAASSAREIPSGDPRAAEVAELEAKIAADREQLRQMISAKRWDSAELASDPSIREIAERLPRLQAELAALRAETVQ